MPVSFDISLKEASGFLSFAVITFTTLSLSVFFHRAILFIQ